MFKQMFDKHSWKITVPVTIVIIFGFIITGYALFSKHNCTIRLLIELPDFLKIETEVNKGQCE